MKCRTWRELLEVQITRFRIQTGSDDQIVGRGGSKGGISGSQERFVESKQLCRKATEGTMKASQKKRGWYYLVG